MEPKQIYYYQQIILRPQLEAEVKFEYDVQWDGYMLTIRADNHRDIITTLQRLSIAFDVMAKEILEKDKNAISTHAD